MYFDAPVVSERPEAGQDLKLVLSVNGLAVLALGLMPEMLLRVCLDATLSYPPWQ
jgi:NADH-quinone oxidoreductase subunit N